MTLASVQVETKTKKSGKPVVGLKESSSYLKDAKNETKSLKRWKLTKSVFITGYGICCFFLSFFYLSMACVSMGWKSLEAVRDKEKRNKNIKILSF